MSRRRKFNRFRVKAPDQAVIDRYGLFYPTDQLHFQPEKLEPISAGTLFGNQRPLTLDLGCGRGEFLVSLAHEQPDENFVGFDSHRKSIYAAINQAHQHGLQNVKLINADLRWVLQKMPDETAKKVFLLFPPPVMKKKYLKRDLLTEAQLDHIYRILQPGGHFYFVTDSGPYFTAKLALIEARGGLSRTRLSASFEGGITRYQQFWENFAEKSLRAEYIKSTEEGVHV